MVGASFDGVEANRKFAEKYGFDFPLLCDTERSLGVAYGAADDAKAGAARRIAYVIGPDGKIRHAFPKVTPKTFPDDVLGVL